MLCEDIEYQSLASRLGTFLPREAAVPELILER